jgi:hypothetical protein
MVVTWSSEKGDTMSDASAGKFMVAVRKRRGHPALRWRPQSLAWVPAVTLIIIAVIWSAIFTMADKQLPSNSSLRVAS